MQPSPLPPASLQGQVSPQESHLLTTYYQIACAAQLNQVIFKNKAEAPIGARFFSLFPGLGYAAAYKVLQRVYKYGGQPFVRDYLGKNHGDSFDRTFGKGHGKTIMNATAGSIIGIGEIVILPLDVLKIKRQTNPEAFRGRGVMRIVADEGFGLYRGWGWTAARNAPGSFAVSGVQEKTVNSRPPTDHISSSSVVLQQPRNTSTSSPTTTPPHGPRTLSPPLPVHPHHSSSPPPSTLSRPVSRTATSRLPSLASALSPTWPRMRV